MATCVFRDEPCDRTDIKERGLCPKHYHRAVGLRNIDEAYPTKLDQAEPLICRCTPPTFGDECPRCHRLTLTLADDADRIAYLRTLAALRKKRGAA